MQRRAFYPSPLPSQQPVRLRERQFRPKKKISHPSPQWPGPESVSLHGRTPAAHRGAALSGLAAMGGSSLRALPALGGGVAPGILATYVGKYVGVYAAWPRLTAFGSAPP